LLGYRVLEADNGQTAMKLWQENSQQICPASVENGLFLNSS